jgi:hypothetical protein
MDRVVIQFPAPLTASMPIGEVVAVVAAEFSGHDRPEYLFVVGPDRKLRRVPDFAVSISLPDVSVPTPDA